MNEQELSVWAILGVVVGVMLFVAIMGWVVWACMEASERRKKIDATYVILSMLLEELGYQVKLIAHPHAYKLVKKGEKK